MEQEFQVTTPSRRWWRSSKVIFLGTLIALLIGAYWLHEALFLSADLQRMQGSWKLVRVNDITDPAVEPEIGQVGSIKGHEFFLHFDPSVPHHIQVSGDQFILYDPEDTERSILGYKVRVPAWLWRPNSYAYGTFECDGRKLMIWLKGEVDSAKNQQVSREDQQEKWYLERLSDQSE